MRQQAVWQFSKKYEHFQYIRQLRPSQLPFGSSQFSNLFLHSFLLSFSYSRPCEPAKCPEPSLLLQPYPPPISLSVCSYSPIESPDRQSQSPAPKFLQIPRNKQEIEANPNSNTSNYGITVHNDSEITLIYTKKLQSLTRITDPFFREI